jgi:acetoin utilization deacetylase AcuC-like enzyme
MKKTAFLYDERFLLHETSSWHPEVPERLESIYKGIQDAGLLEKVIRMRASRADLKWIQAVHDKAYIDRFNDACMTGIKVFDCPDNQMCSNSYEIALLAAGGVIDAAAAIMKGEIKNAFCAVRPPGHHAVKASAMGFCYFNNVAVAARYLQKEWGIENIGIVDFDVHHGNGTQEIFQSDPTVFYYSIHQHPSFAYPGTGREFERGAGKGLGFTKNSPVLPGQGDEEYKRLIERDLIPAFESFKPEFIIISAGFDAHIDDDMSDIRLSTDGFSWITEQIVEMAEKYSKGRLLSVLEGGYALHRLGELAKNHLTILLNGGSHVR